MDGVTAAPPSPGAAGGGVTEGARRRAASALRPLGGAPWAAAGGAGRGWGWGGAPAGGRAAAAAVPRGAAQGLSPRSRGGAGLAVWRRGQPRWGRGRAARGGGEASAACPPPAATPLPAAVTSVRAARGARRGPGLRLREFLRTFLLNSDPRPPGAPACPARPGGETPPRGPRLRAARRCPGPGPAGRRQLPAVRRPRWPWGASRAVPVGPAPREGCNVGLPRAQLGAVPAVGFIGVPPPPAPARRPAGRSVSVLAAAAVGCACTDFSPDAVTESAVRCYPAVRLVCGVHMAAASRRR